MAVAAEYEFRVSAPAFETFAWLHGRAEKSGEVVSVDASGSAFRARWSVAETTPVELAVKVRSAGAGSHVTIALSATAGAPLIVVEDFAGPLGDRMTGLRPAPPGFFDPPLTDGEHRVVVACAGIFGVLLLAAVVFANRFLRAGDPDRISGRDAIMNAVVPVLSAALVAGVVAGLAVRRRGRWFELPSLTLGGGLAVSFVVFLVWSMMLDEPTQSEPETPAFLLAIGAGLAAIPETLMLTLGAGLGRIPWALAAAVRRVKR